MARIGIDADGVIADFIEAFNQVVNHLWPGKLPIGFQPTEWDYKGALTQAEMSTAWKTAVSTPNFWLGLRAYSANVTALARWLIAQRNHDVYIVTSRSETPGMTATKQTEWWIKSCGIFPNDNVLGVIVVPDSNEKYNVYAHGGFDFSIDDKPSTIQQCDMLHPILYTHKAALLDRPWNQGAEVDWRVKSLEEFLNAIS
jgi:5' nucleotidase, deoxy (Pyrimidine), cytosolic type C protein (NT5C)